MALSDRIAPHVDVPTAPRDHRARLREQLQEPLSNEALSRMLQEDPQRARRELQATLEMLLRGADYRSLTQDARQALQAELVDLMLGFGPIQPLLDDPSITEVMVNAWDKVFIERDGKLERSPVCFDDEAQVRMIIDRIVAPLGRRVDEQSPMASARLPQGHRVNVVIPPISLAGPILTIRKFKERIYRLDELVAMDSMPEPVAQLLVWAVKARKNIAVSGGTGGGKTTLLNALSCEIPSDERIITIEDSAELRFQTHPHVVRMEARPANAEGLGEVSIRDLVVNALRMRPDRIIVGECRGAEALDMLQAMNTGHDGSMTTLHANSPLEVVARLVMMARYAMDLPVQVIQEQVHSALDLVVQQDRSGDGKRRITALASCVRDQQQGARVLPFIQRDRRSGIYSYLEVPAWIEDLPSMGIATRQEVDAWKQLF
ncbi:MAG: CpaF family protein [Coriobacteriales bacterium]|nr:CpaF family protein [Coriobacteriales bacterium]MBQ6585608.1 CpaF family protein [Coriobacteriales bacterium]